MSCVHLWLFYVEKILGGIKIEPKNNKDVRV